MKKKLITAGIISSMVIITGCSKELLTTSCDGSTPTYNSAVKAIIDSKCDGIACHGSGANRGDYTTYQGMLYHINNGSFENRVLVEQDMPRFSSLTQEQINTIQCWADNGYPEN